MGGNWSIVSGGGSILGATYTPANVSSNTNVTVRYTIAANGACPLSFADTMFVVNSQDTAVNTTDTSRICETGTKALTGAPAGGSWSIVNGGGTISGATYNPGNVSSNETVTVRYTIATNGACPSTQSERSFIVNFQDTAVNKTDTAAICETDKKMLLGSPKGGNWSIVSGGGNISDTTYTPASINSPVIVTIRYTIGANGACFSNSSSTTFKVNNSPSAPIASRDTIICSTEVLNLAANGDPGSTIIWFKPSGTIFVGSILSFSSVSSIDSGRYIVSQRDPSGCTSGESDTVNLMVVTPPTINVDTVLNPSLCTSSNGLIRLSGLKPNTGYLVQFNLMPSATPVVLSLNSNVSGHISISGLPAGTYKDVIVKSINGGCPSNRINTITIKGPAPTAIGSPAINCKLDSQTCDSICKADNPEKLFYISGMDKSTVTGYFWQLDGSGIVIKKGQGTDSITLDFTNAAPGKSSICVVAFNDCDTTSKICFMFEVFDCFSTLINSDIAAGYRNTLIAGNISLNDKVRAGTSYNILSSSSTNPNNNVPVMNSDGTFTFTSDFPGKYVFTIAVCRPGFAINCPSQTLTIFVLDSAVQTNLPLIVDDKAFTNVNSSVIINVLANDGTGNSKTSINSSSLTIVSNPKNGKVVINADGTITYSPNAGFAGSDTFYYNVCDNATPTNCGTAQVIIKVITKPEFDYVLDDLESGIGLLAGNALLNDIYLPGANPTLETQVVFIPGKGKFTIDKFGNFTWSPANGFIGSVQIPIRICNGLIPERCYTSIVTLVTLWLDIPEIPNYISPNGDGSNDSWCIDGLLIAYPNSKVLIYNRWGNVVWRSTGPYGNCFKNSDNIWYGQKEGSNDPVPDGVYYYLLELEDKFKTTKTGFIEVMRR